MVFFLDDKKVGVVVCGKHPEQDGSIFTAIVNGKILCRDECLAHSKNVVEEQF